MNGSAVYEQAKGEFACEHESKRLCVYRKINGTTELREQCTRCGGLVRTVKKDTVPLAKQKGLPDWDQELKETWYQHFGQRYQELATQQRDEEKEHWWASYTQYLESIPWRAKRAAVLKRCNYVCEGCHNARATEVHHLTYEHVGHELHFELVGICHDCHKVVDNKQAPRP